MLLHTNADIAPGGNECGDWPYTVTVSFADVPQARRVSQTALVATSCFGSGAQVLAEAPGGVAGPLAAVLLVSGGRCYARRGRTAPTLSVTGTGSGAEFAVTLSEHADSCGIPYWSLASITASGGQGYADGSALQIQMAPGDWQAQPATATVSATDGVPSSVQVTAPGQYYREHWDNDVAPHVAEVFFGSGPAVVRGIVDADVLSETFGEVVDVVIEDAGSGYVAWTEAQSCLAGVNGESIVLRASSARPLVRVCGRSPWGTPPSVAIDTSKYDGVPGPIPALTQVVHGTGLAQKGRQQPAAPTFTTWPGSGASFEATWTQTSDSLGLPAWRISEVAVTAGGQGYTDGADLVANSPGSGHVTVSAVSLRVRTRTQPTVTATVSPPAGFTGRPAVLEVSVARLPGLPALWAVSGVQVLDGGEGYTADRAVVFAVTGPNFVATAASAVAVVNDGQVTSVRVHTTGRFYRDDGAAVEVEILAGGLRYRETNDVPPYVADLQMAIEQIPPSNGAGANVVATIDTNPLSATFGRTTAVTLEAGGDRYSLLGSADGRYGVVCEGATGGAIVLRPLKNSVASNSSTTHGRNRGLELTVASAVSSDGTPQQYEAFFRFDGHVAGSNGLDVVLSAFRGVSSGQVSVSPGGRYCGPQGPCCQQCAAARKPGTTSTPADMPAVESIAVTVSVAYLPCGVDGQVDLTLTAPGWSASADIGVLRVTATLSVQNAVFRIALSVVNTSSCAGWANGFVGQSAGASRAMDAIRVGCDCCPVGFEDFAWTAQPGLLAGGTQAALLSVSADATVVFA